MKGLTIAVSALLICTASAVADGHTSPLYKNPHASVDDRVEDLLRRMTIEEKAAQLIQGDITNWLNLTDNTFNASGLAWNMRKRAGQFWTGYPGSQEWISQGIKIGQDYLLHNTTLGIPAFVQNEGIHGFLSGNATIFSNASSS